MTTRWPGSDLPSMAFLSVPYPLAPLRTISNGVPDSSATAVTKATAPSSGPASRSNGP